jgi:hypothetical protein
VVCEGNTEKELLCTLRGYYRIPSLSVKVLGQVGVPKTIVDKAKETAADFDEAWVVFDRDDHPGWDEAIRSGQDQGMGLAVSNPCVELWGLLLHQAQTAHIDRKNAQTALSKVHPKYHHEKHPYFDRQSVLEHSARAHQRAEHLVKSRTENADPFGNPSTRLHYLVARLSKLGRIIDGEK